MLVNAALVQLAKLADTYNLPVPVPTSQFAQRYCRACGCKIGPGRSGRACQPCLAVERALEGAKPAAQGFARKTTLEKPAHTG